MDTDEELVFLNGDADDSPAPRPRQRWLWLLLAAVLAAAVLVQANRHPAAPSAAPATSTVPPPSVAAAPRPLDIAPVTVIQLGHPLLGETGNWTLFALGEGVLVRIDLARGEMTRTVMPLLESSGPVSFVPVPGEVIIRPIDMVPSYVVPDGRTFQSLPTAFGFGGPILPGPDPSQLWVDTGDQAPSMRLSFLDGGTDGTVLRLPPGSSTLEAVGDGAGYLLVRRADGIYRAQPGQLRRISTGSLLATGPTGWLVSECDRFGNCQRVLIDRATGRRRNLGPVTATGMPAPWGAISPDGSTAAILDAGASGRNTVELLDLSTGSLRETSLDLREPLNDGTIRWAPDSRLLFAVDVRGGLTALQPATGQVHSLPGSLPALSQLAVRSGG